MEGKFAEKEQVEAKRIVKVKKVDGKSYSTTKSHSKQEKDTSLKGHFVRLKVLFSNPIYITSATCMRESVQLGTIRRSCALKVRGNNLPISL